MTKCEALSHHAAGYVRGTMFQQLLEPGNQIPAAHGTEVVEGKEMEVFRQVTRKSVELVQHSAERTHTHTHTHTHIM